VPRGPAANAWIATGIRHAEEALRIAPKDPDALELRGTLRYRGWVISTFAGKRDTTGELELAERDLRAASGAPGSARPRALSTLSDVLQFAGKVDESNGAAKLAYEADAFLTNADAIVLRLFDTSLALGRFAEASDWCDRGNRIYPGNWRFRMCRLRLLAWSPAVRPDVRAAWRLLDQLDSLADPDERPWLDPQMRLVVAAVIAAAGLRDSAERVIAAAKAAGSGDPDLLYYEALARARLGQVETMARLVKELLRRIPNLLPYLQSHPEFREAWHDASLGSVRPSMGRGPRELARDGHPPSGIPVRQHHDAVGTHQAVVRQGMALDIDGGFRRMEADARLDADAVLRSVDPGVVRNHELVHRRWAEEEGVHHLRVDHDRSALALRVLRQECHPNDAGCRI